MAGWLLAPPLSVLSEPSLIQAGHCPRATFVCPRSGGIVSACGRQLYPAPAAQGLSCTAGHLKRTSVMYAQPETSVARKLLVQTFFFFPSSVFSGLMWIYMAGCWEPPLGTKTTLTGKLADHCIRMKQENWM